MEKIFETPAVVSSNDFLVWIDSFRTPTTSDMGTEVVERFDTNFFLSTNYKADGERDKNKVGILRSFLNSRQVSTYLTVLLVRINQRVYPLLACLTKSVIIKLRDATLFRPLKF